MWRVRNLTSCVLSTLLATAVCGCAGPGDSSKSVRVPNNRANSERRDSDRSAWDRDSRPLPVQDEPPTVTRGQRTTSLFDDPPAAPRGSGSRTSPAVDDPWANDKPAESDRNRLNPELFDGGAAANTPTNNNMHAGVARDLGGSIDRARVTSLPKIEDPADRYRRNSERGSSFYETGSGGDGRGDGLGFNDFGR